MVAAAATKPSGSRSYFPLPSVPSRFRETFTWGSVSRLPGKRQGEAFPALAGSFCRYFERDRRLTFGAREREPTRGKRACLGWEQSLLGRCSRRVRPLSVALAWPFPFLLSRRRKETCSKGAGDTSCAFPKPRTRYPAFSVASGWKCTAVRRSFHRPKCEEDGGGGGSYFWGRLSGSAGSLPGTSSTRDREVLCA